MYNLPKGCTRRRTLTLPAGSLMPSALVPQLICPPYTHLLTELGSNQLTPVIVVPLGSNLLRGYPIPSLNPSATRSWCGTSTGGKFRRPPVPSCGRSLRDSSKICSAIPKCSFCASKFDSLCNFAVAAVCEHSEKPRIAFLE